MQNIEEFAQKLIEKSKKAGASDADILVGGSDDISASVRLGELEEVERATNYGFGLRVFVGKKSAIISSSKFEDADDLVERAVAMAKQAPEDEHAGLADVALLATDIADLDLLDTYEPKTEELISMAMEIEDEARANDKITNSDGGNANFSSYETILATSSGFFQKYQTSHCGISVSVIAGAGTEMQTDYDYSSARFLSDLDDGKKLGANAAQRAVSKLNPKKIPSGKYAVIFEPRIAKGLISDFATGINGSSVARGTSFLKNKLDEQIFSDSINIIDNPHIKRGLASRPFDGEGVANKKMYFIEDGVLKTWIMDTRSANQLSMQTTGHASRGAGSPPSPSSSNLYMEAGEKTPEQLLKDIGTGFYVTETFGMGINYTTGDYSQGAGGFWVENGELAYPISEVTLAGNLLEMFQTLIPANDLEFKYGTNSPTLLIPEMTVAGT